MREGEREQGLNFRRRWSGGPSPAGAGAVGQGAMDRDHMEATAGTVEGTGGSWVWRA